MTNTTGSQGSPFLSLPINVLLLGDAGVGKSTFLSRLAAGPTNPSPSLASEPVNLSLRSQQPDGTRILLSIRTLDTESILHGIETAEHELDKKQVRLESANVLILCYSTASAASLVNAQKTWRELLAAGYNSTEEISVMLLGLKRDLRMSEHKDQTVFNETIGGPVLQNPGRHDSLSSNLRSKFDVRIEDAEEDDEEVISVMPQDGLSVARMLRLDRYAECSSETGELIREVWEDIVGMCVKTQRIETRGIQARSGDAGAWDQCSVM